MDRRRFLQQATIMAGGAVAAAAVLSAETKKYLPQETSTQFMSVLGPINGDALGVTLIHEHIMADFIGASQTGTHRYKVDEVVRKVLPYLLELKRAGCNTFIDCTPAYLGRDVRVLKRAAQESGLNIFTVTGYYTAVKQKFLPAHAYTETAEQLATRWINEWKHGIEGSGVYPGLIKISVDEDPLLPISEKILTAVALTHLETGLSISAHTGNGEAAMQELAILQKNGVHPGAFRWVHAQMEKDHNMHLQAAHMGAWIEFDGINGTNPASIAEHVAYVKLMKDNGFLKQTLISQDAGWYSVGEPEGGNFRGYTAIFETFIPELKKVGFTDTDIEDLLVNNPRESLRIGVRKQ